MKEGSSIIRKQPLGSDLLQRKKEDKLDFADGSFGGHNTLNYGRLAERG
jgi:hypothetical protein